MAIAFLPAYGAVLGAAGAALFLAVGRVMPAPAAALATVILWAVMCDRWIATLARVVLAAAWFWALLHLDTHRVMEAAIAGQTVPRAAMIALAWVARPAASGLELCARLNTTTALLAMAQGLTAAYLCGARAGSAIALTAFLTVRLARAWLYRRRGGVDAGGLASTRVIVELVVLPIVTVFT